MPQAEHIDAILTFGTRRAQPNAANGLEHVLIHCYMGVSRSTAATLMLMAQAHPEASPDDLFAELRRIRPQAWPNSQMIRMADARLGRSGTMMAALRRHYGVQRKARPDFRNLMSEMGRQIEVESAV